MTRDTQIEVAVAPFRLKRTVDWRREEIALWNWYAAAFPGAGEWKVWLRDVAAQLLRRPGQARARLVKTSLVDAGAPPERFAFEGEVLNIGRDPGNDIVLPQSTITRHHTRLRTSGAGFVLEDLGSAMGTISGGTKLTPGVPLELEDGDAFVIFPFRFQLEVERDWLPAGEVAVSEGATSVAGWEEFRRECPVGWRMLTLEVEPVAGRACLAVEESLLRGLVDRALPGQTTWGPVEEAVIEVLLVTALERANRDLTSPFRFALGKTARLEAPTRGIVAHATLSIEGLRGVVRAFLPFELLSGMAGGWPRRAASTLAAQAAWRFVVSAGWMELTSAEQRSIDPGDIVLFTPAPALLFPQDDRRGWEAVLDSSTRLRIAAIRKSDMPSSQDPVPFDQLPLRFQVVVDEHELTLAEAEKLAPGAVLDLDRDPAAPVRLAVNGRFVGTGELVEIEGRMGVRILSWSKT